MGFTKTDIIFGLYSRCSSREAKTLQKSVFQCEAEMYISASCCCGAKMRSCWSTKAATDREWNCLVRSAIYWCSKATFWFLRQMVLCFAVRASNRLMLNWPCRALKFSKIVNYSRLKPITCCCVSVGKAIFCVFSGAPMTRTPMKSSR